jgi:hypothetical protein
MVTQFVGTISVLFEINFISAQLRVTSYKQESAIAAVEHRYVEHRYVEHRYVVQCILRRFELCLVVAPLDSLLFRAPEKALCNGVILTIAFSTPATDKPMGFQ